MRTFRWLVRYLAAITAAVALLAAGTARAVTSEWVVRHDANTTGSGFGRQVLVDSAGNARLIADYGGLLVLCYAPNGTVRWSVTAAGGAALGERASLDGSGSLYVPTADGHLLLIDANGVVVANQDLSALFHTAVTPVGTAIHPAGGVVVAGNAGDNIAVARFDASLATVWQQELGGAGSDLATAIGVSPQGVAYVTGTSDHALSVWTVDPLGNQGSLVTAGPSIEPTGFAVDATGGFVVTGNELRYDAVSNYWPRTGSALTLRFFGDGAPRWSATEAGGRFVSALALAGDGSVFIAGSYNWDGTFQRYDLIKYGEDGTKLWEQTRDIYGDSSIYGLTLDQGEPVVTGEASYNPGYILTVKYSAAGAELWSQIYQFGSSVNGANYGRSVVVDARRNVYVAGYTVEGTPYWYYKPTLIKYVQVAPDLTAPVTSVTEVGTHGTNSWFVSPVTVTLGATDPGTPASGVKELRWSLDGGAEVVVPGSTATVAVSGDGTHRLAFHAVDNAGNVELSRIFTYSIDMTPPVATATTDGIAGANGWWRSATVTISGTDATSGVWQVYYAKGPGVGTQLYATTVSVPMDEGITTLLYAVVDVAQNVGGGTTTTVKVDGTPPTVTMAVSPAIIKASGKSQPVKITGTATDATSGVASTVVRVTDKSGLLVTTTALGGSVNLVGKKGQVYTFTAVSTDVAGNSAQAVATVTVQ
jgi:hypothetical protein